MKKQQVTRPSGRKQSHGRGQAREFPSRPERQMKRDLRGKKPCTPPRLRRAHLRWASRAAAPGNSRTVFVSAFEPRTHAVLSGCVPALSSCFPGQGESPPPVPCARKETRACGGHTCGGQVAHAPSRRRAVCVDRLVTRDAVCSTSATHKQGTEFPLTNSCMTTIMLV